MKQIESTLFLCVVLSVAPSMAMAGPALWHEQKTGDLSFDQCKSRAIRALETFGFTARRDGRMTVGLSEAMTAVINCYGLTDTRSIVTVMVAGGELLDPVRSTTQRLDAYIWGGGACPMLAGDWLSNGRPTRIEQNGDELTLFNEHSMTSRGRCTGANQITALDWEGGLRASVTNDEIQWANGSRWVRRGQSSSAADPTPFLGAWTRGGSDAAIRHRRGPAHMHQRIRHAITLRIGATAGDSRDRLGGRPSRRTERGWTPDQLEERNVVDQATMTRVAGDATR